MNVFYDSGCFFTVGRQDFGVEEYGIKVGEYGFRVGQYGIKVDKNSFSVGGFGFQFS